MRLGPPRSLSGRLVVTMVLVVAVAALVLTGATTLAMRDYVTSQLDSKVVASAQRAEQGPPDSDLRIPPPDDAGHDFGNQEPGTLFAFLDAGQGEILSDLHGDEHHLNSDELAALEEVPADGSVHEVDLGAWGEYRVVVIEGAEDEGRFATGLPTNEIDRTIASLMRWQLGLAAGGVLVAGLLGAALVRRQLRPLAEVADIAHRVAAQPLDSGEIGALYRVPGHLTDEGTEVGRVGAALDTLLAHVEASLTARHRSEQQVRQFVADASHELRTPLTTIAGYTELARRRTDASTAATALAKVEEEAARMTALVEDLLLLARLDAGRPLARQTVDLTRLLVEAVDDARVVAPDHRWQVVLPDDGSPVEVTGDADRLHQVVTNLLTNARKHTPAGTTVTVAVKSDGFQVHDDGPGFPPGLASVAFERFSRGDASRHREGGAGLGLALVDAIVTAHGGTVALESLPGDTTIRVTLP